MHRLAHSLPNEIPVKVMQSNINMMAIKVQIIVK